jgi:hypothetical protein
MKSGYHFLVAPSQKPKRKKKPVELPSLAAIARRRMEVQRLREQISQAELGLGA